MKVLFWCPPWIINQNPFFYKNCLLRHLIPQANLLSSNIGWKVDFILPEFLNSLNSNLNYKINKICFSIADTLSIFGSTTDQSYKFYKNENENYDEINKKLFKLLKGEKYDVIFLYETPVPFLEQLYPESLIIHQSPGFFNLYPYPATTTFDPMGLYKRSLFYLNADMIQNNSLDQKLLNEIGKIINKLKDCININQIFKKNDFSNFEKLALVPLQVSSHYNFKIDTNYNNQMDFILDVLRNIDPKTGVLVTQYINKLISDEIFDKDTLLNIQKIYPNLLFKEEFNKIPGVSQLLLPLVDEVITCSSSIGIQSILWNQKLNVIQNTFLLPFANPKKNTVELKDPIKALNIISFIISRYQPLTESVIENKNFLNKLIIEMLNRKRLGIKDINLLPLFTEIDNKYLDNFSLEVQNRSISKKVFFINYNNELNLESICLKKFNDILNNKSKEEEILAVTFDVFDTLISRPTELPTDIFKILEQESLKISDGITQDFSRIRTHAEITVRRFSQDKEIKLEDIYLYIGKFYNLTDQVVQKLIKLENELEINLAEPRELGKKLFDIALLSQKPVYLISDMYLNEFVLKKILLNLGFGKYKKLYLSSSYNETKKEGTLFKIALKEINLKSKKVLHIGDNYNVDVKKADRFGMRTFYLPKTIENMSVNKYYNNIYKKRKNQETGVLQGIIAKRVANKIFSFQPEINKKNHKIFTDSFFQGSAYNLGYAGLGPILAGFILWLSNKIKKDEITKLYFFSREGFIFKKIFENINSKDSNLTPSDYLLTSRYASFHANFDNKNEILRFAKFPFQKTTIGKLIHNRYGITKYDFDISILKACDFNSLDDIIYCDTANLPKIYKLVNLLTDYIITTSTEARSNYKFYLKQQNVYSEKNSGVVDLGWRGNIQSNISNVINKPLNGYYYATLFEDYKYKNIQQKISCYVGKNLCQTTHPSIILKNRHLFEYLLCNEDQTFMKFKKENDKLIPEYFIDNRSHEEIQMIKDVHKGCIEFANDLSNILHKVGNNINSNLDSFFVESTMKSFLENINEIDLKIFPNKTITMEDLPGAILNNNLYKDLEKNIVKSQKKNYNKFNNWIYIFEKSLIQFICDQRKYKKYLQNRKSFFIDSKYKLVKSWYQLVN